MIRKLFKIYIDILGLSKIKRVALFSVNKCSEVGLPKLGMGLCPDFKLRLAEITLEIIVAVKNEDLK